MSFNRIIRKISQHFRKKTRFDICYNKYVTIHEHSDLTFVSPFAEITGDIDKACAYVSMTEINIHSPYFAKLPGDMFLERYDKWDSYLVDINRPQWWEILKDTVEYSVSRGFRNFFVDNLDGLETLKARGMSCSSKAFEIMSWVRKSTENLLFVNRGFDLYPKISHQIDGVLIEGFFFSGKAGQWEPLNGEEVRWREFWVTKLLEDGKRVFGLDYCPMDHARIKEYKKQAERMSVDWIRKDELLQ